MCGQEAGEVRPQFLLEAHASRRPVVAEHPVERPEVVEEPGIAALVTPCGSGAMHDTKVRRCSARSCHSNEGSFAETTRAAYSGPRTNRVRALVPVAQLQPVFVPQSRHV